MFVPVWLIILFIFVSMAIGVAIGFAGGLKLAYKMLISSHIVGDIVYTDLESEEVSIAFHSEDNVHKMKDMKFVVFGVCPRK